MIGVVSALALIRVCHNAPFWQEQPHALSPLRQSGRVDAIMGLGRRPRNLNRTPQSSRRASARESGNAQSPPRYLGNLYAGAGPEGLFLLGFNNAKLKLLAGKTLAQVASDQGKTPEDTAMDLVIEDGSRVGVTYFLMDEANVRKAVKLPWMSFGSDAEAPAPEGCCC